MRLIKTEIEAITSMIEEHLKSKQKERINEMFEEYKNSEEYQKLTFVFSTLFTSLEKFNEEVPDDFKIGSIKLQSNAYSSYSDMREITERIRYIFGTKHAGSLPTHTQIANQVICSSIGSIEIAKVIESIEEVFSKQLIK